MKGNHAITAFVDAHPEWKPLKMRLTAREQNGTHLIYLEHINIGKVWEEGRNIYAEMLMGYTKLGE